MSYLVQIMSVLELGRITIFDKLNLLVEEFFFEWLRKQIDQIENYPEDEKENIVISNAIHNIFLLRRIRDPFFRFYLLDKVRENKWALREAISFAKSKIHEILKERIHYPELRYYLKSTREKILRGHRILRTLAGWGGTDYISIARLGRYRILTIELYREKFLEALKANDLLSAKAAELLYRTYITGRDLSALMPIPTWLHLLIGHKIENPYLWFSKIMKFLYEKIGLWAKYGIEFWETLQYWASSLHLSGINFIEIVSVCERDLFEDVARELIHEIAEQIFGEEDKLLEGLLVFELSKMIKDTITIAEILWFESLSLEEKIKLLNIEFSLEEYMEAWLSRLDHYDEVVIFGVGRELIQNHLYTWGKRFFERILNTSTNNAHRFFAYDGLAKICRMIGDYKCSLDNLFKALEAYKFAYKNKAGSLKYIYDLAIIYKNIAKSSIFLGKENEFREYFGKIMDSLDKLDDFYKTRLLYNLANMARETNNFVHEADFLRGMLLFSSLKDLAEPSMREIIFESYKRLLLIEDMFRRYGEMANRELKFKNLIDNCNAYLKTALKLFLYHFQTSCVIDVLDVAYKRFQCPRALLLKALVLLSRNDVEKSFAILSEFKNNFGDINIEEFRVLYHIIKALVWAKRNEYNKLANELFGLVPKKMKSDEDYEKLYSIMLLFLEHLFLVSSGLNIMDIADSIANKFFDKNMKAEIYKVFGIVISFKGLLEVSLELLNKALEYAVSRKTKFEVLNSIGSIYTDLQQYETALKYYNEALKLNSEDSLIHYNLAQNYFFMSRFEDALRHINKAIEISRNEEERVMAIYIKLNIEQAYRYMIQLEMIDSEKAKRFLEDADRLSLFEIIVPSITKGRTILEEIRDATHIAIMYAKGLESLLHEKISLPIREKIIQKSGSSLAQLLVSGGGGALPILKRLIDEGKSISLGQWVRILEDINKRTSNPIYQYFKNEIKSLLNEREKETVKEACRIVNSFRRGHTESLTIREFLEARPKIIESINKVINILAKTSQINKSK